MASESAHDHCDHDPIECSVQALEGEHVEAQRTIETLRMGTETFARCLEGALGAMNEAIRMTTEQGPAAAIEYIADYLIDTDGIDDKVAGNAPSDWLTRWSVSRAG